LIFETEDSNMNDLKKAFKDKLNILKNLNIRRLWNIFLIYLSYYLSVLLKKSVHFGKPFSIAIEPTTACNLGCTECPSGLKNFKRPTGKITTERYKMMIDQLASDLVYLILYFQGEPYLSMNFFDMIEYAKSKRIYVATSTNAHFLDDERARRTVESGLDRLIISIDGVDQKTYESYRRGGNLEKVKEGIRNVVRWKKELKSETPYLIGQYIVFGTNEHQLEEIKVLCNELGIDKLEYKTAQVYNYEHGNELIPENEEFTRYRREYDQNEINYRINSRLSDRCFRMWRSAVITWDGLVVPCCFDKDADHQLGDIKSLSFKEIWNSDMYKDFRNSILKDRKQNKICRNCTEGLKRK